MSVAILAVDDEQDFLDSVHRMLRIEGHGDVTAVTDPTAVAPQQPEAVAVKRADEGARQLGAEQLLGTLTHLCRRLVGEGDRHH
jgi:CheY-like chemotaxis protein